MYVASRLACNGVPKRLMPFWRWSNVTFARRVSSTSSASRKCMNAKSLNSSKRWWPSFPLPSRSCCHSHWLACRFCSFFRTLCWLVKWHLFFFLPSSCSASCTVGWPFIIRVTRLPRNAVLIWRTCKFAYKRFFFFFLFLPRIPICQLFVARIERFVF